MKNLIILIITCLSCFKSHAQFASHSPIAEDIEYLASIFTTDIDGDGFMDVLSASSYDNKIAWHRNQNGLGDFSNTILISDMASGVRQVIAEDVDSDGDMDILATLSNINSVVWFENLDGQGTFGDYVVINNNALNADRIHTADFNNDGFNDLIFASSNDFKLAWHENINGTGVFGSEQIISTQTTYPTGITTGDMDSDGDIDVVVSSYYNDQVVWYENIDGQGTFGTPEIVQGLYSAGSIATCDLDGDGDLEILYTLGSAIGWHENLDSLGNFGPRQDIGSGIGFMNNVVTVDIDNDNDSDVLATSSSEETIIWFENLDGTGNFSQARPIGNNLNCPVDLTVADLNNDNIIDIIGTNTCSDSIYWFENGVTPEPNPNLFGTWFLYSFYNNSSEYIVSEMNPAINPVLTISEDLSIAGNIACYSYNGNFDLPYNESWVINDLSSSPIDCDPVIHPYFDFSYWGFIQKSGFYEITQENNELVLTLNSLDGNQAIFKRQLLSTSEFEKDQIVIYPNPSSSNIHILKQDSYSINEIELININGQKIKNISDNFDSINISDLSSGIYLLIIHTNQGFFNKKFMKY